ncbi:hypothetical protein [Verrucomicrobium sp. BvORR106]|uniref:hypothetical protein n=1 Tax=Verrucomicrobium sp. BvORR106 TaxID=1403819 RepID=UPI00056EA171|nr:hypothetical protein [Verrucomicrobium sp. BvORR106]
MKNPVVPLLIGVATFVLIAWTVWTMQQLPPLGPKLPMAMMPVMYKLFSQQPGVLLAVPVVLTGLALLFLRVWPGRSTLYYLVVGVSVLFLGLIAVAVPPTLEIAKNGPTVTRVPR